MPNNQISSIRKYRKKWQDKVVTWFNQPARKERRRAGEHLTIRSRPPDQRAAAAAQRGRRGRLSRAALGAAGRQGAPQRTAGRPSGRGWVQRGGMVGMQASMLPAATLGGGCRGTAPAGAVQGAPAGCPMPACSRQTSGRAQATI